MHDASKGPTPTPTATFIPDTYLCSTDAFYNRRATGTCDYIDYNIYVGSATGSVEIYMRTGPSADRVVVYDGATIVGDTGFAGDLGFPYDEWHEDSLTACNSASVDYPVNDTSATQYSITSSFQKTSDSEVLTLKVPNQNQENSYMAFGLSCVDESFNWTGSKLDPFTFT